MLTPAIKITVFTAQIIRAFITGTMSVSEFRIFVSKYIWTMTIYTCNSAIIRTSLFSHTVTSLYQFDPASNY